MIQDARSRGWSQTETSWCRFRGSLRFAEQAFRREVDVDVKYAGYEIPDEFVVGFGLDFDERYRNLDSIAVLKPSVYQGVQA